MRVNGNLTFDAGRIKGIFIESFSSHPDFDANEQGRIYFNTEQSKFYYNDGESWQALLPESESQPLSTKLTNLAELNSTKGFIAQTGDDSFAKRTLIGAEGRIAVASNPTGESGNPVIDLATVTNPGDGGFFVKIVTDSYGRVTNSTAVTADDITSILNAVYVNVSGSQMSGTLDMGNNSITSLAPAVLGTDAVNLNQLQSYVAGLSWKLSVRVATLENIPGFTSGLYSAQIVIPNDNATYFPDSGEPVVIDGVTLINDQRVLVKNQTNQEENGIYVVTNLGEQGTTDAVLERAADLDVASEFTSASVLVTEGSQAGTGWTQTETITTVDTDNVIWVQFTGSGLYTGGSGINISGNTFSVRTGAGIGVLPQDEVGIDLYDSSNGALILTTDGSARSTATGSKLHLLLDPEGNLEQSSDGLAVKPTYFLYEASEAATEHQVVHNLNQQYCHVTVVDSNDAVIVPQSIVFDDEDTLTVTFSTAVQCKVVVMGVASTS